MGFPPAERSGDIVLRAEGLAKAYSRPLFAGVDLEILRGQRWGILGPNGCGKTTLLRCLLGQIEPDAGRVQLGHALSVGYFDQHLSALDDALPVMDAIRPEGRDFADFVQQKRRDLLARFGLIGDLAVKLVGTLSGGERCRAALARLAAAEANLLVLDEPTNHLDLWARDALEQAIRSFDGTVLFVSHDRYFVNRVADHLLVIEPGRVRMVEGNYAAYQELLERAAREPAESDEGDKSPKAARPAAKTDAPAKARPKRRFPYRKVEDLERDIARQEALLEQLHAELADPATHRNAQRVRQVKARLAEEQQSLQDLYAHWEEAVELNW